MNRRYERPRHWKQGVWFGFFIVLFFRRVIISSIRFGLHNNRLLIPSLQVLELLHNKIRALATHVRLIDR